MKKNQPTATQADAIRRSKSLRDRMRTWFHDREVAAEKRKAAHRKAAQANRGSRGVDRVPARLRGLAVRPEWVHQHAGHPYAPYINPDRDQKPSARLR